MSSLNFCSFKLDSEISDLEQLVFNIYKLPFFYFRDRDRFRTVLGIEIAWKSSGDNLEKQFAEVENCCRSNPLLTFFSMLPFDLKKLTGEWSTFGGHELVLPFLLFEQVGSEITLFVNCSVDESKEDALSRATTLLSELSSQCYHKLEQPSGPAIHTGQYPDKNSWELGVNSVLKKIESGKCSKVVLARKEVYSSGQSARETVCSRFKDLNFSHSYLVCFSLDSQNLFVSTTPERLFKLTRSSIEVDSIAGSNSSKDKLLSSTKDLHEHREVSSYIEECLKRLTEDFERRESEIVIDLLYIKHLYSSFKGVLRDDTTVWDIISNLHPTPAVGGNPKEFALECISDCEPFERGLYAAPIGIINRSCSEFVVGIRSALLEHERVHLFGGAGIVKSSNPKLEWNETSVKMEKLSTILLGI